MILRRSTLTLLMIYLYAFTGPMGNLARLNQEEGGFGLTTVLLILIVLRSFNGSIKVLQRNRVFKGFALLISWFIIAAVFAPQPLDALIQGITLILYLFAAITAFQYFQDEKTVLRLLTAFCLGGFLSATASVVDFAGLINIPGVNEVAISTKTEMGRIVQASGSFPNRSAMAAYYSLIISIGFLLPVIYRRNSVTQKIFFFSAGGMCCIALMLTHNRAGVLSALFTVGAILFSTARTHTRMMKSLLQVAFISFIIVLAIDFWFPDVWFAYEALLRIGNVVSTDPYQEESDALRFLLFEHTLTSVLYNPIGHGYSLLSGVTGFEGDLVDAHNIISEVIWASGLFGLVWLVIFGYRAIVQGLKILSHKQNKEPAELMAIVLFAGLLSFLMVGMTHMVISTGIAWILFGALARMVSVRDARGSISVVNQNTSPYANHLSELRR